MKWLLFLFIIECAGTAALKVIQYHSSAKRYFLIGYVANQGNHIFTGGEDTVMKNYPNRNQLVKWLSKKNGLENVHILSVSEQYFQYHNTFWSW